MGNLLYNGVCVDICNNKYTSSNIEYNNISSSKHTLNVFNKSLVTKR